MYVFLSMVHVTCQKDLGQGGAGMPAKPLGYSCSSLHTLRVFSGAIVWW